MVVGASEFCQAEGVERIGLATSAPKARASGLQLVRMDDQNDQAGFEKALDQEPVWTLDGDAPHAQLDERGAQGGDASLVVDHPPLRSNLPSACRTQSLCSSLAQCSPPA